MGKTIKELKREIESLEKTLNIYQMHVGCLSAKVRKLERKLEEVSNE